MTGIARTIKSAPTNGDRLDSNTIQALVSGTHGAPFDVLGVHQRQIGNRNRWIVRAFIPGAESVCVVTDNNNGRSADSARVPRDSETGSTYQMHRLHPAGLFSVTLDCDPQQYMLRALRSSGDVSQFHDPYSFAPMLTDFDLYLIGEGKHYELYNRLGAHPKTVAGIAGVAFAVWAPNARRVSVVGDFNGWDDRTHPMRLRRNGIWELFIPGVPVGNLYKFSILSWNNGYRVLKADPLAFAAEVRPGTASRIWELEGYQWNDSLWMSERQVHNSGSAPISIYELHLGSWRQPSGTAGGTSINYRDLALQLAEYMVSMGYTHVELMPVTEYPFDDSWGYQVTGYFAPTSRYGTPQDFMYFVDTLHQRGIGVILDWVPAHFPRDEHGLSFFDGSFIYEHEDPRKGDHPDWGTKVFNFGRNEVRNFLTASALFWLDKYHVDGLRVDAVASMLYLDYSRSAGEWTPNRFGGRENLEAVTFVQEFNQVVHSRFPNVLTIAEESTAWPKVTAPVAEGGLGFSLKWNMGWMHDVLQYMRRDPIHRSYHLGELTFSMVYAYSERFVLALSHDEVVHMKGSLLNKMPGDVWQKFANLRLLYTFMYGHPGKKLIFMGGEFGPWTEWNHAGFLDWHLVDPHTPADARHRRLQDLVRDLNVLLRTQPALSSRDFHEDGFEWIDASDAKNSVIAFIRYGDDRQHPLVFVCNFTPQTHHHYRVGVPWNGTYDELLNSDSERYGGSNVVNTSHLHTERIASHGRPVSLSLSLPPLGAIILQPRTGA